jgi:hypothetical protein
MTPLLLALSLAQPPLPVYPEPVFPAPVARPLTIDQFARCFVPTPGFHVVCLVHPVTCRPVTVAFTLPAGCPRVKVRKREVEFDYGRREVELEFRRNGTVDVENR